jgi:hypothetical protein
VVAARHVEMGETVAPGTPLMTGFDLRDMRVIANIPQYKLAKSRRRGAMRRDPLAQQMDRRHRITVLPSADVPPCVKVRIDLRPTWRHPRHVCTRPFLGGQRAQAHHPVECGGAPPGSPRCMW